MDIAPTVDADGMRRRYSDAALASIPKLLQLQDRNPCSPSYGSFDRSYWHYRTMDFPCGMYQEFCLPLALAYRHDFPDNPYRGLERMRQLALAGVDFARRTAHPDGSCDDYFPFERALGAVVFSLYACSETCLVLEERDSALLEFFERRGQWLLDHNETGRLTNHQAFAALALQNVFLLTGEARFAEGRDRFLGIVADWQDEEGWFQEYEGADPGYHSCSIAFLSKLLTKTDDGALRERLLGMLGPAVDFAWHFMHPDGSYAGEYGSRNTYHFYPHGFEVLAPHFEKAGQIADQFLTRGLPLGTRYFNEDDRMCAHYVYDWFQAYLDYHPQRPAPLNEREDFVRYFPNAKLLVRKTPDYYAVLALAKGGVLKVTDENGPLYSDTGILARMESGKVLVSHLMDPEFETEMDADGDTVRAAARGRMAERRHKLATPFQQVLFRLLNLSLGRFTPNLLRSVLQKILITGKTRSALRFERRFELGPRAIRIENRLEVPPGGGEVTESIHVGSDATSIYVANSNVYQKSVLLPWQEFPEAARACREQGRAEWEIQAWPASSQD